MVENSRDSLSQNGVSEGYVCGLSIELHGVHAKSQDRGTLNPAGEEFGEERLKEVLRAAVGSPAGEIAERLADTMRQWIGSAEQHDDLTFVVVAMKASSDSLLYRLPSLTTTRLSSPVTSTSVSSVL